ncbi:hypothetical protein MTR67_053640 [Solanum verrucosum]|uniref:Reverse transcriptase zinc-binding domain-containing protein n=1 Tax=Solanum verrucosum TaxID=315347 RepID=A0AAF0V910_SOLVR|nr:hypothetical protein MTR67_053640 [Solanum verrucosum]
MLILALEGIPGTILLWTLLSGNPDMKVATIFANDLSIFSERSVLAASVCLKLEDYESSDGTPAAHRLQFSEAATSAQVTPTERTDYQENRTSSYSKTLSYVPPSTKQGKPVVTTVENDLKTQYEYWKNALIGYVVGDTPLILFTSTRLLQGTSQIPFKIFWSINESVSNITDCPIPSNATWVIRKIFGLRQVLMQALALQGNLNERLSTLVHKDRFSIKRLYLTLTPQHPRVHWKSLALNPSSQPRFRFILWLAYWKRLPTADRLLKIGI